MFRPCTYNYRIEKIATGLRNRAVCISKHFESSMYNNYGITNAEKSLSQNSSVFLTLHFILSAQFPMYNKKST